jgi:uncharacterized membrane protein YgcG
MPANSADALERQFDLYLKAYVKAVQDFASSGAEETLREVHRRRCMVSEIAEAIRRIEAVSRSKGGMKALSWEGGGGGFSGGGATGSW